MPASAGGHAAALKDMEAKIDELPLLPQVLVRLLQLRPASVDYFENFESLVKEDPAFAVRVISLANSSTSAPVSPIETIRDALTRMGAVTIGALVASLAVQKVFMPTEPGQVRLWSHSILAA
ncbi:MAG: HDOD domain-containing protein, partial [Pseudomonadota bacterium]